MERNKTLLTLVVHLAVFCGVLSQEFNFQHGLKLNETCGPIPTTDWSTEGSVTLTRGDHVGFEQKVIINALAELCTVDLSVCPPPHTVTSSPSCYCKSRVGDRYDIHIGTQTTMAQSGMTLQAVVPGKGPLRNIQGAITLGRLPDMTDNRSPLKASYTMDDGKPRDLLNIQTVKMCPGSRLMLEVCVQNAKPGADLKINVGIHTTVVVGGRCVGVNHKFTSGEARKVTFEYKESHGCIQHNFIYLEFDITACLNPTNGAATSPFSTPTTVARTPEPITTRLTEATTTTSALQKINGVCPDTPRTVTTLPSGRQVLMDHVTFNTSWTIFQRRASGAVNFSRPWSDYVAGFGDVTDSYWLGLEEVHQMCNGEKQCKLLIHLKYTEEPHVVSRRKDGCYYALYSNFWLSGAEQNYTLNIGGYTGTAGDDMTSSHDLNKQQFTTFDQDHDQSPTNCAAKFHNSGWWYRRCTYSSLNGVWGFDSGGGLYWRKVTWAHSALFSEMKIGRKT